MIVAADRWLVPYLPVIAIPAVPGGNASPFVFAANVDPRWAPILDDDEAIDYMDGTAGFDHVVSCNPGLGSFYKDQAHTNWATPLAVNQTQTFGIADGLGGVVGQASEHYYLGARDGIGGVFLGNWFAITAPYAAANPGNTAALAPFNLDWFCNS